MIKKDLVIIADYNDSDAMSFNDLRVHYHISADFIHDLAAHDIIALREALEEHLFDVAELRRIKIALRLQRDLEVNVAGVAVILDLLDEMKTLRTKTQLFEKHLLRDEE